MRASRLAVVAAFLPWAFPAAAAPPSAWLDFTVSSSAILAACRQARAKTEERLDALGRLPAAQASFQDSLLAFSNVISDLNDSISGPSFLGEVSTDPDVRNAGHACDTDIARFMVEAYSREDLYTALKAFAASKPALQGEDARLLEKTLLAFKRNGLELPARKRVEVQELKKRIVELETEFRKALSEDKTTVAFAEAQLDGLPDDFRRRLPREGDKRLVSLDYPDYFPFMENARDPDARRELEARFNNRGGEANSRRLAETLALRRRAATLLGYPSHAAYVLEERMAKTPQAAASFLAGLQTKLQELARGELAQLAAMKQAELGDKRGGPIRAWDWRYYHNQLMKTRYQVDEEKIKEYFPLNIVTGGMLQIYQQLLGVAFQEVRPADAWHPDVQLYRVADSESGKLIGHFYLDLFPREGKYKHAAAFSLVQGRLLPDGSYQRPVSAMVANFNKPDKGRPSLLRHGEVETYFHEFGHLMHQVLTRAKYQRFSGTSVARDFVEAPSQMLENWVWRPEVLARLSGFYRDFTQTLPDELLRKMIAAKNVGSGLKYLRQDFFAAVDLQYHGPDEQEPNALYGRLLEEISLIPMTPGTRPEAGFGHLMSGYDAAYYGYLWSEVFAQDMFSRFEREGVMNGAVGREYRRLILEPGGSVEEAASLRAFLGREPDDEAFLRSIGLKPGSAGSGSTAAPR
ncbi:MAG: Zn-dependent oligopeptidase [Elusimicrobia bacterium]|nr:Zn-dependent oligopeptidase [Elusimicrobiota bacterium]